MAVGSVDLAAVRSASTAAIFFIAPCRAADATVATCGSEVAGVEVDVAAWFFTGVTLTLSLAGSGCWHALILFFDVGSGRRTGMAIAFASGVFSGLVVDRTRTRTGFGTGCAAITFNFAGAVDFGVGWVIRRIGGGVDV